MAVVRFPAPPSVLPCASGKLGQPFPTAGNGVSPRFCGCCNDGLERHDAGDQSFMSEFRKRPSSQINPGADAESAVW
jgi:hypothetical protein